MSTVQWLIWLVPEMIKTLLITYGIFGFKFKKWRWWIVVVAYIAGPLGAETVNKLLGQFHLSRVLFRH